jgi:trk system potassium uptake protein TrkA
MKIVIIGGGKVGSAIAGQLTAEGHDITVVDSDSDVVENISNSLDCMAICGNGAASATMREADVQDSDVVIACTAQDELNLLCCVFAKRLGCRSTIARVRTPDYADQLYLLRDELGLSMTINPEQNAAYEMFRLLEIPSVLKRDTFANDRIEIVEVIPRAGELLDGLSLTELPKKLRGKVLIGAVARGDEVVIPDGHFQMRAGDHIYLCAPAADLIYVLNSIGDYQKKASNVMLIGAGRISEYLTASLLKAGTNVKVIERDREKARAFAERYPAARVICADGANEAVLREENAAGMDAMAMLTNLDEENLVLSMYAAGLGIPQVLTKVDHTAFGALVPDKTSRIISTKKLCADAIIRYVRAMQNTGGSSVVTLHHLVDGKVDALEFNVTAACRGVGRTLREVRLKPNILIACINRRGDILIPTGADRLEPGDTVVIITASDRVILDLNDIFADED